jgi:hypothetical protein
MYRQHVLPMIIGLALLLCFPWPTFANGCLKCHQEENVTVSLPEVDPILYWADGRKISLNLPGAFAFHSHECPGMTITYLAIQYGFELLYGDEIPERSDLLISARTPSRGPMDMIDLIMKGDDPAFRTWPPVGMKGSPEGFFFTIFRKSTCEAVDVRLMPGLFPNDFMKLKQKEKNKTITPDEWDLLHGYMKKIITTYPVMTKIDLFGEPKPYKSLWWGHLEAGEMDRHIRRLRQRQKADKSE